MHDREKGSPLDEYQEWDGDDSTPLETGDILFRNDDKRTQRDVEEGHAYQDFRTGHFFGYALAYKEGADRLVEALEEDGYSDHKLVLPIIFLYRHYLELHLKDLILEGRKALGQPAGTIPTGHNIFKLWDKLKPILAQIQAKSGPIIRGEQDAVEAYIKELTEIDERSEAFRYPVSTEGKPLLQENAQLASLCYIDLQHLAEHIKKIAAFFMDADMMILMYGR